MLLITFRSTSSLQGFVRSHVAQMAFTDVVMFKGDSALEAGVRLLPYVAMIVAFALINGALMPRFGYYLPWYLFGGAAILIGSSLMYTISVTTEPSTIYGYTALVGIGVGSYLQAGYPTSQCLVSPAELADVIGFMSIGNK